MRRRAWLLCGFFGLLALGRAAVPPLLDAAVRKLQADEDHWAYTQTTMAFDRAGKAKERVTVERYDPSRPVAEQWSLLQWQGHEPTAGEMRTWKKRKDREQKRREEKTLGEIMDLGRAHAVSVSESEVVFEVPLLPGASQRLPADKFVVLMTVDPARETLQGFNLKTLEPFRAMGVAKIERIEIEARFHLIDERYAPQPGHILAHGTGKLLFFRVGGGAEITWSDFKRVKPYQERFEVKIGEMKAFGF
ncbi:MAG: hypothetical protein K9M98_12765 [Cephaloticoccus sp.]|nr:hypothetical protein [Cephaloticoccus sp.]